MQSPDELARMRWKVYGERTLYDHRWVRLVQVDIEPPSGERWWHHVVRLNRVAIAVVLDDAGRVLMLWRHRFATDEWGWELPGGIVDGDEDSATTAAREVEEETGWRPHGPLRKLLEYQPMPGMVDTPHELYLARGAEKIGEPTDADEAGIVSWIPLADVPELIARGEVLGSGSLVGLLLVMTRSQADRSEAT